MKKVVYILGAGFSAPLNIPIMRQFIDRARQIREGNEQYKHFDHVIKLVQETVSASLVFRHDPVNVEEVLSLLQMKDTLSGGNSTQDLVRFGLDVIKASTPPVPRFDLNSAPPNAWGELFSSSREWQGYCAFVSSLAHLDFHEASDHSLRGLKVSPTDGPASYAVLSLNYDMVLENAVEAIRNSYWPTPDLNMLFSRQSVQNPNPNLPRLVKIHGSVDTGKIIIPSFVKQLNTAEIPDSWRLAHEMLYDANEIRVIGYSLPQTDSYIKYLLMASLDRFRHLNRIDWIVKDSRSEVLDRVRDFLKFEHKRFAKADVLQYFQTIFSHTVNRDQVRGKRSIVFDRLEQAHEQFMVSNEAKTE